MNAMMKQLQDERGTTRSTSPVGMMSMLGVLSVAALAALTACASQVGAQVAHEVAGGAQDYVEKPMYLVWEGEPLEEGALVCLESQGERVPGQVEHRPDGQVRIWFLASVEAGETRTYEVHVGEGCADASFSWEQREQSALLSYDGVPVVLYEKPEYDEPASQWSYRDGDIKKPAHHAYAPDGSRRITKGPYGRFQHHQGIYFGYNQISWDGGSGDTWHGARAYQQHVQTREQWAGPVFGGNEVQIDWTADDGEVFITEIRRVKVFKQSDGNYVLDFESTLESRVGDVVLDGDNHHAGIQFRASQYVADNAQHSRFLRPAAWAEWSATDEHAGTLDMPWNTFQFMIEGEPFSVAYLTNPANPEGRKREMSERLYGRFGEWIPTTLSSDESLTFAYRYWITGKRDELEREHVDAHYEAYTGTAPAVP